MAHPEDEHAGHSPSFAHSRGPRSPFSDGSHSLRRSLHVTRNLSRLADLQSNAASFHDSSIQRLHQSVDSIEHAIASTAAPPTPFRSERHIPLYPTARSSLSGPRLATSQASARGESSARTFTESRAYRTLGSHQQLDPIYGASYNESEDVSVGLARREYVDSPNNDLARGMSLPSHYQNHGQHRLLQDRSRILGVYSPHTQRSRRPQHDAHELHDAEDQAFPWAEEVLTNQSTRVPTLMSHQTHLLTRRLPLLTSQQTSPAMISQSQHDRSDTSVPQQPATPAPPHYTHQQRYTPDQEQQPGHPRQQPPPHGAPQQHQRPAFLSQPVYQLACAACIRPLCLRAMKAVMLSDHSKELYSTDMPPAGLQLVNDDRQVRHCACRIRDSACLGCGQIAGYHVTQPCSDCLKDQNNGHFWMFYSSAVFHYKRHRIDGPAGGVMLWANVPPISYDQSLAQQLRLEVPILTVQTRLAQPRADADPQGSGDDRPLTACVEMEEWLTSPISEVVCR